MAVCSISLWVCVFLFHQAHLSYLINIVYLHSTSLHLDAIYSMVRLGRAFPCQTVHRSIKISVSFLRDNIQQYSSSSSKLRNWAIVSESSSAPELRLLWLLGLRIDTDPWRSPWWIDSRWPPSVSSALPGVGQGRFERKSYQKDDPRQARYLSQVLGAVRLSWRIVAPLFLAKRNP